MNSLLRALLARRRPDHRLRRLQAVADGTHPLMRELDDFYTALGQELDRLEAKGNRVQEPCNREETEGFEIEGER